MLTFVLGAIMSKRYVCEKLEHMREHEVFVRGFLHEAPHRNYSIPEMVCATQHSPFS